MALLEKQLKVKRSTLPGAGKGLFTTKFIPGGTRIVEYKGKITSWKDANTLDGGNGYIYYVKRYHVIDALPRPKAIARYANDAQGMIRVKGITNNCDYVEDGLKVYIESKKDIPANSEIFVGYGKEYWDVIKGYKKRKDRAKKRRKS
ncbi:MAG: SET domain-containing protein [Chitinophagaceae bacterium]|nr:SET domain-containing protein [Chitinophagaceae bacterium]